MWEYHSFCYLADRMAESAMKKLNHHSVVGCGERLISSRVKQKEQKNRMKFGAKLQ